MTSPWIMNARMYAVAPEVEAAWRGLLERVADEAGVELQYMTYPAPQPMEALWRRPDLGCVFMCGYPIALKLAPVVPIAAPIPRAEWANGKAVYRSDLIARADAPYERLEDTFGGRAGWTVAHSHSGFNAFRHHLLGFRTPERPALYREMVGDLVTARAILDGVRDGRIDVGPLDAYWHMLIRKHRPELTEGIRVLASTELAPMPAFVASAAAPAKMLESLEAAFVAAASRPWFAEFAEPLLLDGFVGVREADFEPTLAWDREARAAGYERPA
jgi:ABC-type phosphate/phosphonate transport system substrate-binding protein